MVTAFGNDDVVALLDLALRIWLRGNPDLTGDYTTAGNEFLQLAETVYFRVVGA